MSRVALITGAARGIGKAIALRLARDGLDISLNDIPAMEKELDEVRQEIAGIGRQTFICLGDVSVENDVIRMVDSTVEKLGSLDVMIANAGVCMVNTLTETSLDEFHRMFSINVDGVFLCYKYAALQMIKQGKGGRIIGATSLAGKQGWRHLAGYSASKFAVRGLTQASALQLIDHGITVNAYAPGGVETDMLSGIRQSVAKRIAEGEPGYAQGANAGASNTAKAATPEHIAGVVSYLVSPEAEMITGQSVSINGGRYFD